jgi:hypothetical protein
VQRVDGGKEGTNPPCLGLVRREEGVERMREESRTGLSQLGLTYTLLVLTEAPR